LNQVSNLKFWEEPIAAYKVEAIPATFILDASENVVARDLRGPALRAKVIELLAKKIVQNKKISLEEIFYFIQYQ
jgi:hypothetical protein